MKTILTQNKAIGKTSLLTEDTYKSLECLEFTNETISKLPCILMDKCHANKLINTQHNIDLSKCVNASAKNENDMLLLIIDYIGKDMKILKKQRTN